MKRSADIYNYNPNRRQSKIIKEAQFSYLLITTNTKLIHILNIVEFFEDGFTKTKTYVPPGIIYPAVERVIEAIDFNNGLAAVKNHFGFPRIGKNCRQPRGHRIPSSGTIRQIVTDMRRPNYYYNYYPKRRQPNRKLCRNIYNDRRNWIFSPKK
ncbi:hypothetical protein NQ318_014829 [Aromia moschata]|uniref:Uncharacterized protein n=1 Tax=Aromia moschata TaxID=1265417 RepID=A0AAV8ZBK8_9CUCU|nr:hypothetical protein NQ318_014829 [Aromia moschata]